MAMSAATSFCPSSISTNNKQIAPLPAFQPRNCSPSPPHHLLSARRKPATLSVTAAVAPSAVQQVDGATTSGKASKALPFRIGHGFDLHRLEPGYPLIIGGINIPHERGCEAHSDGDVLLHCVVDAILGALSLPDIGQIFPDNDPKWKGAASSVFIKEAVSLFPFLLHDLLSTCGSLVVNCYNSVLT
ncbi:2-C-methyl-D-erythritol 2,4-cyclodiphosphate synthase, chloroplastic [Linum perenne]